VKLYILSLNLIIILNPIILLPYRFYNIFFGFWIIKRLSHQRSLRLHNIGVWYHFVFFTSHVN
jgi:hypothetical protein